MEAERWTASSSPYYWEILIMPTASLLCMGNIHQLIADKWMVLQGANCWTSSVLYQINPQKLKDEGKVFCYLVPKLSSLFKQMLPISLGCYRKTQQTGELKQNKYISHCYRGWSLRSRCQQILSGEGLLPGLETVAFLLWPHMAFPWWVLQEREASLSSSSKGTNPI